MNITDKIYTNTISGHQPFLKTGEEIYTYGQLREAIDAGVYNLRENGILKGDRVALWAPNTFESLALYLALVRSGIVPVVINIYTPANEFIRIVGDKSLKINYTITGPGVMLPDNPISNYTVESLIKKTADIPVSQSNTSDDDPSIMMLTSGTSGKPKPALYKMRNLQYAITMIAKNFWEIEHKDTLLLVAPFSHMFGQYTVLVAICSGAAISLIPRFDPETFFSIVQNHEVSFIAGVPMLANLIIYSPVADNYNTSSLKKMMLGGAFVHPRLLLGLKEKNILAITGFGMTEGAPVSFLDSKTVHNAPQGTVGRVSPKTSVKIVDDNGEEKEMNEYGEIWVKGEQMIDPSNSVYGHEFKGEWFKTGDIGRVDENGYLFWIERKKNVLKVAGYSVYPAEIENVLLQHPKIGQAAVVGIHNDIAESLVAAFVVPSVKNLGISDIRTFCKENLSRYKIPGKIIFKEDLPKNQNGKVDKTALMQEVNAV